MLQSLPAANKKASKIFIMLLKKNQTGKPGKKSQKQVTSWFSQSQHEAREKFEVSVVTEIQVKRTIS